MTAMAWDDMRVAWVTLSPRRDEGVCRVAAMAYGVEPDAIDATQPSDAIDATAPPLVLIS